MDLPILSYDPMAGEYYSADLHPTCANFGDLSARWIASKLAPRARQGGTILEVGAGRSVAADILAALGCCLDHLILQDLSRAMLSHSSEWEKEGAAFVFGDARRTGLPSCSVRILVSSLGDPYNDPPFWQEVARLLEPGGICLFTSPAIEWASRFRPPSAANEAEFVLADHSLVSVPSFVLSPAEQSAMIEAAGLRLEEVESMTLGMLRSHPSPKLDVLGQDQNAPIVRGYLASKPISSDRR